MLDANTLPQITWVILAKGRHYDFELIYLQSTFQIS